MLWHGKNFRGFLNKAKEVLFNNTGTDLVSTNAEDAIKEVNSKLSVVGTYDSTTIAAGTDGQIKGSINVPKGTYVVSGETGYFSALPSAPLHPAFAVYDSISNTQFMNLTVNVKKCNFCCIAKLVNDGNITFTYSGGASVTADAGSMQVVRIA